MRSDSVNLFWKDAQIKYLVSENLTESQNCIAPEVSFTMFERSDEILKGFKSDIDKRFEQVDGRFSSLKADMDKRFEQVDKRQGTM
jgi:hypothetical protein